MWTRTYLVLLMVRLYFAISPSYIHPDENFQGPEVIAGKSDSSLSLCLASVELCLRRGTLRHELAAVKSGGQVESPSPTGACRA